MARPSIHDPFTKSYAIDQITDIEYLRAVTHRMWEAFFACHTQSAHIIGALAHRECERCYQAIQHRNGAPCERYKEWQRKVTDGFGSI